MKTTDVDIENRIRMYSIRRHTPLDLQSAATKFPTKDKLFLAIEFKKSIQLTRIKNSFNRYLPKFIVRFDLSDFSFCKIRPSWLSGLLTIILPFTLLSNIFSAVSSNHLESELFTVLIFNVIFFTSIFLEYRFTIASLHLALKENNFSFE